MKESYEKQISFPKIKSAGMEIILEYIYTGSVKEESLTKDNTVEAFYAADYFQLSDLQDFILKTVKNSTNFAKNYSPELLSKISEKMPLTEDNILLNLLVEAAANISLNNIKFGRLSITGLKYLLSCTYEKENPFATPEYENSYQKVAKELETLVKFIDFRRIKPQILADIIEPLEIIPDKIISNVYQYVALSSNLNLNNTRGISINEICYDVWDKSACGSKLVIEDNGKIVYAPDGCGFQSVRTKIVLEDKGIFEWDVIIEKNCSGSWVGVCAPENLNYEYWAEDQPTGWVLGSRDS
uniref:BTB domain-containing protein n=1 Tax=Rhizophagus irregularis (strain DAOM 181602 / DAOM 197198 / MUCL 43194) TaxID=747089 RepID=U9T4C4_RHIID